MASQQKVKFVSRRRFLKATAAVGLTMTRPGGVDLAGSAGSGVRDIADELQLFLDDWIIERLDGLRRVLHQPEKNGVILNGDGSPWDRGDCYAADGNLVCRDEAGRFHMTYRYLWWDPEVSLRVGDDKAHWFRQVVAYATSDDGIRWHKPNLGLVSGPTGFQKQAEFPYELPTGMSNKNNLGCPFDFIWDLSRLGNVSDGEKRFLLRVVKKDDNHPFAKIVESQMYYAADWPDFVHDSRWREKLGPIADARLSPRGFKTLAGYDHQAKVWFQVCQDHIGHWLPRGGRDIARFTSPDLITWHGPELVLPIAADESRDPKDWVEYMFLNPHRLGGVQSGAWLGQLEIFHSDRTNPQYEVPVPGVWRKGTVELRLVMSRDAGQSWQRVGDRQIWLPHHADEHGYDRLAFGALPVRVDDELWFYYPAWDGDHLVFHKDGSLYEPGFTRTNRTARATLRLDGFMSLDADETRGELLTRLVSFRGAAVVVNLKAPHGELRVEIQDRGGQPIPGFRLADCQPTHGDAVALPVRWRNAPDLGQLASQPVRLRFVVRNASFYSFRFA